MAAASSPLPETQPVPKSDVQIGVAEVGTQAGTLPKAETPLNPLAPEAPEAASNRKRKLENAEQWSSAAFKLRAIFKGLRPHFLDVLCAPEFRKCEAADEIRKQMQIMMELTRQLKMEAINMGRTKRSFAENQVSTSEQNVETKVKSQLGEKQGFSLEPEKHPHHRQSAKPVDMTSNSEEIKAGEPRGSHVVGGSPLGWNFTMFPGSGPVYCGESKEMFQSRQAARNK